MSNNTPVSRFEHTILIPMRLTDGDGKDAEIGQVSRDLLESKRWVAATATPPADPPSADPTWLPLHDQHQHQAYAYFHPFVRRFLYDPSKVMRLHRADLRRVVVEPQQSEPVLTFEFDVTSCELWLFAGTGVALLRLDLHARPEREDATWPLHDVQRVIDQLRRLYPPYFEEIKDRDGRRQGMAGGRCPKRVEFVFADGTKVHSDLGDAKRYLAERAAWVEPGHERTGSFSWATHWESLLWPLVTRPRATEALPSSRRWHALQLGDDRAPCMSYVGFSDKAALQKVDNGNWMRLCFADAPGTDELPYQRGFVADFERHYCYDRYWYRTGESMESPSRIMNCGYAFMWAGSSDDPCFFANETNGAIAIFRHIYVPMGIIAQFHHAALLAVSARMTSLPDAPDPHALTDLYRGFIIFTQRYWFDEISPQVQGRELFSQWRRELGIQELFDEVRLELRDMIDVQSAKEQVTQSRQATFLAHVALPFAALSVFLGFVSMSATSLGMNSLPAEIKVALSAPFMKGVTLFTWGLTFATPLVLLGVIVWYFRNRPSRGLPR